MSRSLFATLTILLGVTATLEAASLVQEFGTTSCNYNCYFKLNESSSDIGLWNLTHNPLDTSSCVGRCGQGLVPDAPCQCNRQCMSFNDCCSDYSDVCNSITDQELHNLSEELLTLDVNTAANFVKFSIQGRGVACSPDLASDR